MVGRREHGETDRREGNVAQMSESPRIRDQKALTTSTGRVWLVVGAILTAVFGGMLVAAIVLNVQPVGVAIVGVCLAAAEYAAMIVVRLTVKGGPPRLITMACLAWAEPATFFVCFAVIRFIQTATASH